MKNRIKHVVAVAVCLALLTGVLGGCDRIPDRLFKDDGKIHIVTSIFAAYDFARQVGGERAEVRLLLTPGCEAHSFEPTPQDIIAIEQCDIFVCTGGENDAWVDTILDAIDNPGLVIIRMAECACELYEEEEVQGMQEEGGLLGGLLGESHHHHHHAEHDDGEADHDHDEETEWDEHVWMDLDNAANICEKIAEICTLKDPAGSDVYRTNCSSYCRELEQLDSEIWATVSSASRNELIFADRFPARYFTERYGLRYYAAFPGCSESAEASAATVSFLIDRVREDKVPVVLKMELSSGKLADVVAEESGTEVATFYTGHNVTAQEFEAGITFADMMRRNSELLKSALN